MCLVKEEILKDLVDDIECIASDKKELSINKITRIKALIKSFRNNTNLVLQAG
jgi:hypothetical protein